MPQTVCFGHQYYLYGRLCGAMPFFLAYSVLLGLPELIIQLNRMEFGDLLLHNLASLFNSTGFFILSRYFRPEVSYSSPMSIDLDIDTCLNTHVSYHRLPHAEI